ncbi:MAG: restriction endonuclease subunit S [Kiritimatiellae bacterium]|nr:restriction endonuclease subunit S [Kiritimatiellia bacterium]
MIATGSLRQKLLDLAVSGKLTETWRRSHAPEIDAGLMLKAIQAQAADRQSAIDRRRSKSLHPISDSEKYFEVPDSWQWCRLGSIVYKITDGTHKTPKYVTTGIRFVSAKDVGNEGLDFSKCRYISESEHVQLYARCNPEYDDILITKSGSIGAVALVKERDEFSLFESLALIKYDQSLIFPAYLKYALLETCKYLASDKVKGVAVKHLHLEVIASLVLPLPPLEEQKRIVARLEELLALEREIAADGAALDDLVAAARRKILDLAVSGKLVPRQGEWKRVKGKDLFADTESRLPEGDFFDYIDIDAIDNKAHRVVSPKHLKVSDAPSRATRGIRTGDTIFSIVRPYLENIAYIDESLSHCIASTGFHVCRPRDFCDNKYLFMLMTSPYVIQGLNAFMKGDNSPSIRKNDIMNFAFPIPPLAEQKAIVKRVDELMALLDAMKG